MHQILFDGVENDWYNALPLGNGRMGAMIFRKGNAVHIALNHYDCYYRILSCGKGKTFDDPARRERTYGELCGMVEEARRGEGYEDSHYVYTLNPQGEEGRPRYGGSSYPSAGEILLRISPRVDMCHSRLFLLIEEGKAVLEAGAGALSVRLEVFAAREEDGILMKLEQTAPGLWEEAEISVLPARGQERTAITEQRLGDQLVMRAMLDQTVEACGEKGGRREQFLSETALTAGDGAGEVSRDGRLKLSGRQELVLSACVQPEQGKAVEKNRFLPGRIKELEQDHREYWSSFWVSGVKLPDSFLETLWYLNLYMLSCCNGSGGKYPEQACGLSGLWDIRKPNMWGSTWYWDVNIQTVFQGAFAANHLELARVFCDGYLSYEEEIRAYTRRVYGREGWAADYPHTLYNCIQPWCAQLLWNYYLYTGDLEFLKKKAYPVFREQIAFLGTLVKADREGVLHIDPDISPEQGPVGRDSVITVSCMKKLLKTGIEAAGILGCPEEEKEEMRRLLTRLPSYPETGGHTRLRDSALSPENIFLRHPSILMPVYPAGEITFRSGEEIYQKACETLCYAADNTETGTFGFSWLSCAASALGMGDAALSLLYEKGLDHILHSNGLGYEESERFINYCHITKQPHYLPAMCEAGGGIVSAVNAMLLSAGEDGVLTVFPAIPEHPAWKTVRFWGMLAPGGFEVSACRRDGKPEWIQVTGRRGGELKLSVPQGYKLTGDRPGELTGTGAHLLFKREMQPGEVLKLSLVPAETETLRTDHETAALTKPPENSACAAVVKCAENSECTADKNILGVQMRVGLETGRRIFLGEDRHTAFYKAWDSFTCPYMLGDSRQQRMTPYILDFTPSQEDKAYLDVYGLQEYRVQRSVLRAAGPIRAGLDVFDADRGYGFDSMEGLELAQRPGPDEIRRDFAAGRVRREFWLELPGGKYDLLLISGDEEMESQTTVGLPQCGMKLEGEKLAAGRYQCRIMPVYHERDGILRISIDTECGGEWRLNAVIVNKEYARL